MLFRSYFFDETDCFHANFTLPKHYMIKNKYLTNLISEFRSSNFWFIFENNCYTKNIDTRPDLKICWFAVTRVCFFKYSQPVGKKKNYHFEMEKIALISVYLTWFLSSSLRFISRVYFFYDVHASIMNLA